ncbi:triose phosphate isomerase [Tieghemostelium lacteum]|uniref:Triosephosphate isomerase n=1 Tax=Tieghemostelium lacteum TaxID=361077 RepID=A0A151ZE21_TIELA|nr:triose phosphate isomerase [Tieghemostelium lacteum]|eukprot:KYQ92187.1 triose phosphate isomerase [Tieghemostelium lacteum]
MTRRFLVGGNHKCNGNKESLKSLIEALNCANIPPKDTVEVVIAPPTLYLDYANTQINRDRFSVSAQNCYSESKGAFTGEISAEMIRDLALDWVILGHSERRHIFKESNELIAKKTKHSITQKLQVIFCVGEQLSDRNANNTEKVLDEQLHSLSTALSVEDWKNIVIAYEPVWAIGTGVTASPQQAQDAHVYIRKWLAEKVNEKVSSETRILYGGSVTATNAAELAQQSEIDGFLVGGASLVAASFITIIQSVSSKSSKL